MASDDYPSRPIMRTWRPEAAPQEEVVVGGPRWRRDQAGPQRVPFRKSRYFRTGVLGLLALFFIALLIWVSSWLSPPRPACLVLIGAGYEENLAVPANVYGRKSMGDLADLTRAGAKGSFILRAGLFRLHRDALELRRDSVWDTDIDTFAEKTIILYFALHGGSDAQGPYLLPTDADLGPEPANRLRLKSILERLKGLPKEKGKLLILDATQSGAWWPLGMLHNDFVRGLTQLEEEIKEVPNLVVLSSTDVDQRSWGSDDWRRSIFAHYLIEGLAGAADDQGVGRIHAWQLHQYVGQNVERWSRINRQALQTPLLLPSGEEGEKRARGMYLTMTQTGYQAPDPTQLPTFTVPSELTQAWNDYRRLSEQVPAPTVYSPHLWRQYQATLLRYEQLVLAKDMGAAGSLAGQLRSLERRIQQAQRLELSSLYNTLAMPAAAGLIGSDPPRVLSMLNDLWDAPPADQRKLWAKQQQSVVEPVYRRVLPARMADQIIDRAAENPGQNLDRACQVLQVICDPLRPRPAEVHFLTMVRRDLQKMPPLELAGLVSQSLRVRRLAENAALGTGENAQPYSEQIVLWTGPEVIDADQERRQGEDLIFASDKDHWKQGNQHLETAESRYRQVQTQNTSVRTSLAVRDQLLSGMPYYAQWLAQRRLAAASGAQQLDTQLLAEIEDLWQQTQQLTVLLERNPPPGAQGDAPDYKGMLQQANSLDKRFRALETRWTESWRESTAVDTPATWRDCFDALVVPITDPQLRMRLVSNYRRISRELLIRAGQNESNAQRISVAANRQSSLEHARRQGRMALAVLGQRTFDEMLGGGRENYQEVMHRVDTFAVEEQWWVSLIKAGEQVGYRFVGMPTEIDRQVVQSQKLAERDKVRPGLRQADRLARCVPGPLTPAVQYNAADLYRRWLFQDLLLGQSRRTLDDHWFAEEENADRPYFRSAGTLYIDDAKKLIARQAPQPALDTMIQKLNLPGDLVLSTPPALVATSEQSFSVDYQVRPGADAYVPPGLPVFWAESDRLLQTLEPPPDLRLVRTVTAAKPVEPIRAVLSSPLLLQAETKPPDVPRRQRAQLRMRGLFRGQRIERQTPVDLYPTPEITYAMPPLPATADLVVRAPKELHQRFGDGNGSIVIVMDCSGSMGEPPGTPFTPKTKFNEMTGALKIVLQKLPKGTTVSLWIFGQAIPPNNTAQRAEDTIRRLQDPIQWDPKDTGQLAALMKKVQYPALVPWNESPIVRSMLMAKNDLKNATGFKTLLVLTDGMDNCFKDDKQYNPKGLDIPTVLRESFQDSGIAVNIIGFKVVNKEEATARAQFKTIEDLPLPGKFLTVNDANELAIQLERAMRQRLRYWLDREDNSLAPGTPSDGLDVSTIGSNDQWYPQLLTPSGYKVRTYTSQRLQKSIILDPGDLLLVDLDDAKKGQELRRGVYSREDYPGKPWKEAGNWRFAALQNQRLGDQGLQMLTTLERVPTQTEVILQVIKPRDFWFELRPRQTVTTPFAQRWVYHAGYPAPAWSLDVPAWPLLPDVGTPALPAIRAWWNPDQEWPAAAAVETGPTLKSLLDVVKRSVPVGDDGVVIENVQVEKHVVQTKPGLREAQSCLVVRLRYDPLQPVRARTRGLSFEGQEHRWYTEAGCYTGLFWPVTEQQAKTALTGVGIVSLTAFKRDAEQRGYTIDLDKLAAPQANDVKPQPPVELK